MTARLRHFDRTFYRMKAANDPTQVPLVGARVEFYAQGATVSSTPNGNAVSPGGGILEVLVYDPGTIGFGGGDTVLAGPGGPALAVVEASPTKVKLRNDGSTATAYIYAGVRLIKTSGRPTLYQGLFGTPLPNNYVDTDSEGRARCYLDEALFDFVVKPGGGAPSMVDSPTWALRTGIGDKLTWYHNASGADRLAVVGVSWRAQNTSEQLTGVTYGGIAMKLLLSTSYVAVYYLVSPPLGSPPVVVNWSGSGHKGAIAGCMSWQGVDQATAIGASATNTGSSTTPSAGLSGIDVLSALFDVLGINGSTSSPSATPNTGQVQRWNAVAGTVIAQDLTRGAASTRLDGAASMGWTLSTTRSWGIVAAEVRAGVLLVIDAEGAAVTPSPMALNVRDFQSLAAALAALPATGGELLLGGEEYVTDVPLVIDKPNVTLRGEGNSTIIRLASSNPNVDVLTVTADGVNLVDLRIGKYDLGGGLTLTSRRALAITSNFSIQRASLTNVQLEGGVDAGLYSSGVGSLLAIGCRFTTNPGLGLLASVGTDLQLVACEFVGNGGQAAAASGGGLLRVAGCGFSENTGGLGATEANAIFAMDQDVVDIQGCRFICPSNLGVAGSQFVYVLNCRAATVDGCYFENPTSGLGIARGVGFDESTALRLSNCAAHGPLLNFGNMSGGGPMVEFGNWPSALNPQNTVPALTTEFSALGLFRYADDDSRPDPATLPVGSMIWVDEPATTRLQVVVLVGAAKVWRGVQMD